MLRIVGVQRSISSAEEFVLIQNQGKLKQSLRGHILMAERALDSNGLSGAMHVFSEPEAIPPGAYVLLSTCLGHPGWTRSRDGAYVYHAFMSRVNACWPLDAGPLHLLSIGHSYSERPHLCLAV